MTQFASTRASGRSEAHRAHKKAMLRAGNSQNPSLTELASRTLIDSVMTLVLLNPVMVLLESAGVVEPKSYFESGCREFASATIRHDPHCLETKLYSNFLSRNQAVFHSF